MTRQPTRNAWRDALRTSGLPPAVRAVANAFAAYWPAGTTYPVLWASLAVLAADTGYSHRHVKRAVAKLEADGWLVLHIPARQHHAPHYRPAIPDTDTTQRGQEVPPGPVDNPPQGGQEVPPAETPGGTHSPSRGDTQSPYPEDPEVKTPLPPTVHSPTDQRPDDTRREGWPQHIHEPNALAALARVVDAGHLPADPDELLVHAYRLGDGDPWVGFQRLKPSLEGSLDGARNPRAVLLARITRSAS